VHFFHKLKSSLLGYAQSFALYYFSTPSFLLSIFSVLSFLFRMSFGSFSHLSRLFFSYYHKKKDFLYLFFA